MKNINEMTIKEFKDLPSISDGWFSGEKFEPIVFDSLIILPVDGRMRHDSGYRFIDFVAVEGNKPLGRLSGCSDVIHLNGYSMYIKKFEGYDIIFDNWHIDCLPKSGLLRAFVFGCKLIAGTPISDFCVYAINKEAK